MTIMWCMLPEIGAWHILLSFWAIFCPVTHCQGCIHCICIYTYLYYDFGNAPVDTYTHFFLMIYFYFFLSFQDFSGFFNFILLKNLLLYLWPLIYLFVLGTAKFFTVYICFKETLFFNLPKSYSINISPYFRANTNLGCK